jgi:hypothetical protein
VPKLAISIEDRQAVLDGDASKYAPLCRERVTDTGLADHADDLRRRSPDSRVAVPDRLAQTPSQGRSESMKLSRETGLATRGTGLASAGKMRLLQLRASTSLVSLALAPVFALALGYTNDRGQQAELFALLAFVLLAGIAGSTVTRPTVPAKR